MKTKLKDCIKFGFGFYFGYEIAKALNEIAGETAILLKKRIEKGTF